jgi:hypothetical protein
MTQTGKTNATAWHRCAALALLLLANIPCGLISFLFHCVVWFQFPEGHKALYQCHTKEYKKPTPPIVLI